MRERVRRRRRRKSRRVNCMRRIINSKMRKTIKKTYEQELQQKEVIRKGRSKICIKRSVVIKERRICSKRMMV